MTRRAATYLRISRDREGGGLGVDRQKHDCQELAERLGWNIVAEHVDNDTSASSGRRRPGYEALLADLRSGHVNAVIAWHPDRLHRRPLELESFIGLCEERGVAVQTVRSGEVDLSTPSGRAVARTLGAWARHEVEHAGARIKNAKAQAAAAGKYRGGRRPFGFEADGRTVRESEAAVVRDATHRLLIGESLHGIARDLNARGITTSMGGQWTPVEVRRLVSRHRNAGLIAHRGEELAEAEWKPIVDRDAWRAVRALLADPTRRTPPVRAPQFLGSGVFICGVCAGTVITASTKGRGHQRRPSYRCRSSAHLTRMAEPVDEFVSAVVIERLSRPDARLLIRPERAVDVQALQNQAVALRGRLDELGALYGAGDIDARQLATGSTTIRAQLDQVDATLAASVAGSPLAGFLDAEDVTNAWVAASVDRKKAIIKTLMKVTLLKAPRGRQPGGGYFNPEYIRITWKAE
jgi:site-specific DNA recombinase